MYPSLQDVPEALLQRVMDYSTAAADYTAGRHDFRIPMMIADQWLLHGYGTIDTNSFARRFGTTRRTVCKALKRLAAAGVIREIDRANGKARYEPNLEIGDAWRTAISKVPHD